MKENDNKFIIRHQDKVGKLIKMAHRLSVKVPTPQYPFQNAIHIADANKGQALKDYLIEAEKGKGLDWEHE